MSRSAAHRTSAPNAALPRSYLSASACAACFASDFPTSSSSSSCPPWSASSLSATNAAVPATSFRASADPQCCPGSSRTPETASLSSRGGESPRASRRWPRPRSRQCGAAFAMRSPYGGMTRSPSSGGAHDAVALGRRVRGSADCILEMAPITVVCCSGASSRRPDRVRRHRGARGSPSADPSAGCRRLEVRCQRVDRHADRV